MEGGVNQNRGAESTVCLLLARLVMVEARQRLADKTLMGESIEEPGLLPAKVQSAEPSAQAASGQALARQ
jgi:hypothetical protein